MHGLCACLICFAVLPLGGQALKLNQHIDGNGDGIPSFGDLVNKVKGAKAHAKDWFHGERQGNGEAKRWGPGGGTLGGSPVDTTGCEIPQGFYAADVMNGTFKMVVYQGRDVLSTYVGYMGWIEIKHPEDLAENTGHPLPKDAVLLDIGANLGYYSLMFAAHGHKVVAIEPMTHNRKAFNASLCLNPHLRKLITIIPAAVVSQKQADEGTRCVIRSSGFYPFLDKNVTNDGDGLLTCGPPESVQLCGPKENFVCDEPQVKTLDKVLQELDLPRIDVVKMDVEGFECSVFDGGMTLFDRYRPKILKVETLSNASAKCVKEISAARKYKTHSTNYEFDTLMSSFD